MTRRTAGVALLAATVVWTLGTIASAGQDRADALDIRTSRTTGLARFMTARDGGAIAVPTPPGQVKPTPTDFLREYGNLFGVTSPGTELVRSATQTDALGHTHTTYRQVHRGVSVFSGILKVHQDGAGQFIAANGDYYPISEKLSVAPSLSTQEAVARARAALEAKRATVEHSQLVIVDPGWYGNASLGDHLAYYLTLTDLSVPLRERFFVDAHSGDVLDHWTVLHTARVREIYDGLGGSSLPGSLARSEGDPPVAAPEDVNRAYDYGGDVYDYLWRAFARDSIDGAGMTLILTVNSTFPPCPNAQWNGSQMIFCTGTVTDDVTAHEIAHGVTDSTADLIYQNQSGQLNESYSDIFGELIDLFNGDVAFPGPPSGPSWPVHATGPGLDTPNNLRSTCSSAPTYPDGVRWMMGEDATAFGGAIRDMWDPPCEGHPDRANSPLQTCSAADNGGVHSGSGIPNHAFAILTDGKTFNGQTVTGIGPIKAAAVWYRALTTYLTVSSDFEDAYAALNQAAADLEGTFPFDPRTGSPIADMFTSADSAEVDKALLAVEMNTEGACGATVNILNPEPPVECTNRAVFYADAFEGGENGWTVALTGNPLNPYDWVLTDVLPADRAGTAWYCAGVDDGCPAGGEESAVHHLFSPEITVPAVLSEPTLKFTHYVATEPGYDGGNLKISVNGGAWQFVLPSAFLYNEYNTTLNGGTNTNPLAGEPAWSGVGGGWGTSLVDLSGFITGGETIQLAFEFGKDWCNGVDGWYLDDLEIYNCVCKTSADCDDGLFCSGTATCLDGACQAGVNPCSGDFCDEAADTCIPAAFWDDFENGNAIGWNLYAPGSTAGTGDWLIGDPNGTVWGSEQAQPDAPFEGFGCAFTAQNTTLGGDDVDGGVVYLMSPSFDLSEVSSAELRFVRWFFQRDINDDPDDFYVADVSNDDGQNWTNLETLGPLESANAWTARSFLLEASVGLTSAMRVRFGASDGTASGDIIEAAIDNVVVVVASSACEAPTPLVVAEGGRSIAVTPAPGIDAVALIVEGDSDDPEVACVSAYVQADGMLDTAPVYQLPAAWGTVHVRGADIQPERAYNVRAKCLPGGVVSPLPASVTTWVFGDVDESGDAAFSDILLVVRGFQNDFADVTPEAADLDPCVPNSAVNFADVLLDVKAFQNLPYSVSGCPAPCP